MPAGKWTHRIDVAKEGGTPRKAHGARERGVQVPAGRTLKRGASSGEDEPEAKVTGDSVGKKTAKSIWKPETAGRDPANPAGRAGRREQDSGERLDLMRGSHRAVTRRREPLLPRTFEGDTTSQAAH
jgi:hypothetical protein